MELRHLRYFVLVAEELHFGRAARRAGIAQPPLSQQIRSLEGELGVSLFFRTKRRVELTDAGQALLPRAREVLRQAESAERAARDGARGVTGHVAIGFVGSLSFGFLPKFIREHQARFPDIRLDLQELTSEQQRSAIRDGRLDIGLVRYPIIDDRIQSDLLFNEELLVALGSDHSLASRPGPLQLAELAEDFFIMFPRRYGPPFFDHLMRMCHDAGFVPEIVQEAMQMSTIVSLVGAGLGVALVPGSLVNLEMAGVTYRGLLDAQGNVPETSVYAARGANITSSIPEKILRLAAEVATKV